MTDERRCDIMLKKPFGKEKIIVKETETLAGSFSIGKISCVRVKRNAHYTYSLPNGRRFDGFIYVKSGKVEYNFSDAEQKKIVLSAGDLFFIPKNHPYKAEYAEDDTFITIIQFECTVGTLPSELSKPVQLFIHGSENLIHNASIHPDSTEIGECRELYFTSKVYDLLRKSLLSLRVGKNKALASKLAPALHDLSENFSESPQISHYASLCFMSETAFRRSFREYTGLSPVEYRNKLRIEEADRLIKSGEYNVREAAESVGFFNASFFTKTYKSFFGYTPHEHN